MNNSSLKDLLHLRIEQADEKLLVVLAELTESLFRSYQPDVIDTANSEAIPKWAKPLTAQESLNDLREGLKEYEAGEYVSLEEAKKEAASW